MKKTKLFTAIMSAGLLTGSIGFTSCEDEEGNSLLSNIVSVLFGGNEYAQNSGDNYFGWFANDEDTEHQAQDILLSTTKTSESNIYLKKRIFFFQGHGLKPGAFEERTICF